MVSELERYEVGINMIRHGGSFVAALGEALLRADLRNTERIAKGFPDYWKQYAEMGKVVISE